MGHPDDVRVEQIPVPPLPLQPIEKAGSGPIGPFIGHVDQGLILFERPGNPGKRQAIEADLILLSMGFLQPEHYINEALGMDIDERGNFRATKTDYRTSVPKVYAAADCRRGQDLVVRAINEGREAAREIDRDLMGSTQLP